MRVVHEYADPRVKISVFSFNQKWLIKVEAMNCEQTFKIPHEEASLEDVRTLCETEDFLATCTTRFLEMRAGIDRWTENFNA